MALRSLDNALPLSPERPKKIAKVAVSLPCTPPKTVVNDENTGPMDPAPEYVASHDLKALNEPEAKVEALLNRLDSKDWMAVCEALNDVRRLSLHHASLLVPILDKVVLVLVKSMKSPRSALCKTSLMASADIFQCFGHFLLSSPPANEAFDQLLLRLLLTASQDKKFVCEEAQKTTLIMTSSLPPCPLLQKLASYVKHTNLRVRAKAAVCISNCVSKMAHEGMKEFGLSNLIKIAADLLNDRLPEAREAARCIGNSVHGAFVAGRELEKTTEMEAPEAWQEFCSSNLPAISAQAMVNIARQ
ncbi:hypothetical protein H6P81_015121 [Aristolochia fimbriata]|uniref:TOG domain-containing protein n=1 Tax=Aristolochia fimbriata TaxID=158543 RepID=A0AAV7E5U6_ARIFI|nr:hypothetical protein H6P81_015121 [Aristolochia fimbriata]